MTPEAAVETRIDGDELDALSTLSDSDALSELGSDPEDSKPNGAAARQKALAERQGQRDSERKARDAESARRAADAKAKREGHNEKKRLDEELLELEEQMHELDREFRRQYHAPRTIPIGTDRFGNRVWWFDGCGTADILTKEGQVIFGTGRLYIQGVTHHQLSVLCQRFDITEEEINERRVLEEGQDGILGEGEWAMIDESEQVSSRSKHYSQHLTRASVPAVRQVAQRQGLPGKGALGVPIQIRVCDSGWNSPAGSPVCAGELPSVSPSLNANPFFQDPLEDEQSIAQRPKRGGKVKPVLRGKQSYLAYKVSMTYPPFRIILKFRLEHARQVTRFP